MRKNQKIKNPYEEATINGVLKSSRLRWAGHVWRSEKIIGQVTE
jgi:hypothetical protein